jgi:hypothetical protein
VAAGPDPDSIGRCILWTHGGIAGCCREGSARSPRQLDQALHQLFEECRRLMEAGHRAAARRALAAAEELQQLLTQLERAVRPR